MCRLYPSITKLGSEAGVRWVGGWRVIGDMLESPCPCMLVPEFGLFKLSH